MQDLVRAQRDPVSTGFAVYMDVGREVEKGSQHEGTQVHSRVWNLKSGRIDILLAV